VIASTSRRRASRRRDVDRHGRAAGILAVALALLAGACANEPAAYNGIVRDLPLEVGAVSLPDVTADGARAGGLVVEERLVFAAADERVLLVSFGFLNCPDICPTTLLDIRAALAILDPALRERVDVAFVTVDPDRDGPDELAAYLRHFFPSYHAVRGEGAELQAALDAFLASAEITVDASGRVEVAHSAVVYAVDADGKVRLEWPFGTSADAMASDLRTLLADLPARPSASGT
jgi:protein SCO1/2